MKEYTYPACFFEKENGNYTVAFQHSLFAYTAEGENLEEVLEEAMEFLAIALDEFIKVNKEPPKPEKLNMKKIVQGLEFENDIKNSYIDDITIDYDYYNEYLKKSVNKSVTIPSTLDRKAKKYKLNFSKILRDELKKEIKKKEKAMRKVV